MGGDAFGWVGGREKKFALITWSYNPLKVVLGHAGIQDSDAAHNSCAASVM